jgi:pimeloyl-ACP methyl ester carboxylesterase
MQVEANGIKLNVEDAGEGPPVLLLHGFPDSHRLWRNQVPALTANGLRAVTPDLRGFGESERPERVEDYFILNTLEDLRALLDHLEIEKAHIVGHDFGAAAAWAFASLYAPRVESLVAISVGHPSSFQNAGYEQLARSWYMFMFQFEGVAERWLSRNDWEFLRVMSGRRGDGDQYVADLSRPGALTAALNWYRANIPPESWISDAIPLPPVECPTMGIWSSGDVALTEAQMTGSQKFVTGPWRYERIDGSGHWIPLEEPERLSELLLDFLSG